ESRARIRHQRSGHRHGCVRAADERPDATHSRGGRMGRGRGGDARLRGPVARDHPGADTRSAGERLMCDPASAAAGLAVGAGTGKALGTYTGLQSEANAADANAAEVLPTGYQNELNFRDQARRAIADQTVKLAAQGGDISTGTPLLLLAESARNAEA